MWKKRRIMLVLLTLICIVYVAAAFLEFVAIGPGLPPSGMLAEWYLPDSMQDDDADYLSLFPDLSPYAACGNYTRHAMMCTWYFEDQETFLRAENNLSRYLAGSGEVDIVELDLTGINTSYEISGSRIFNATRYRNETTSGYFLVYDKPFFANRDDCYIVYYGTRNNATLQDPRLEKMMARSLGRVYDLGGSTVDVRSLNLTSGAQDSAPGLGLPAGLLAFCCAGFWCRRRRLI
jgi:hypothetical protein